MPVSQKRLSIFDNPKNHAESYRISSELWKALKSAVGIVAVLGLLPASFCRAGEDGQRGEQKNLARPNIVFILADDMGWPDLGSFGSKFNESPRIDRLAQEGMKFTDFYAATPVCSSTRSTIQSGQYSTRTGITNFVPGHWRPFERLLEPPIAHNLGAHPEVKTIGELFSVAGYTTGHFGKWHLEHASPTIEKPGMPVRTKLDKAQQPENRGYGVTERTIPKSFFRKRGKKPAGPKKIDLLTDMSLWFLEQNRDQPFFLTISHYAVHIPVETSSTSYRKFAKKSKKAASNKTASDKKTSRIDNPYYAGMIEDLDRSVGRVLDKLDELGLAENTVVVFTSDNGGLRVAYTGIFSGKGERISSNAPLRDEKGTLYEGGIRVPMIVRWPGVVKPGSVCHEPATTADLLPTFCQMADIPLPSQVVDGLSLVPLLRSPETKLAREAIYFHYPHYHHSRPAGAIRQGDMKLIEFFDDGTLELYDLRQDIGESKNLAEEMPERTAAMQKKLATWRAATGAKMPTENPDFNPARRTEWWSTKTQKPILPKSRNAGFRSRVVGK